MEREITQKHILRILMTFAVTAILVTAFAICAMIQRGGKDITDLKFTYYREVVTSQMVYADNAKDLEFSRLPDHSVFRDESCY